MSNCDYCQGDTEGFVIELPKTKGKGRINVFESFWGSKLQISAPYRNVIECYINYCPMCGRELRKKVE